MGDVLCSVCNLLNTSVHSLFLNSVPLSVSTFFDGQNTQQMLSVYAFITSSAFLDLIRMQKVNPVSMHTAVSVYLFPLLEGGWNSPIKSMAMNSIGCGGTLKCSFWICCTFMLSLVHVLHALQCLWIVFFMPFQWYDCLSELWVLLNPLCPCLSCASISKQSFSTSGTTVGVYNMPFITVFFFNISFSIVKCFLSNFFSNH